MHAKSKLFSAAVLSAAAGTLIVLGCTHSSQCCDDDTQPLTQENAVAGDTVLGGEKPTCRAVLAGEGLSERASPYEYVHDD